MSNKRIYVVTANNTDLLVNATSKQQAINHIAKSLVTAKVASQQDLVQSLTSGKTIIEAVEPQVNSVE